MHVKTDFGMYSKTILIHILITIVALILSQLKLKTISVKFTLRSIAAFMPA